MHLVFFLTNPSACQIKHNKIYIFFPIFLMIKMTHSVSLKSLLRACCCLVIKSCLTLQPHGLQHNRLCCPSLSLRICSNSFPLCQWWYSNNFTHCYPLLHLPSVFPQHQGLFQWVGSSHQVTKVLELQLQHQYFRWVFKVDFP